MENLTNSLTQLMFQPIEFKESAKGKELIEKLNCLLNGLDYSSLDDSSLLRQQGRVESWMKSLDHEYGMQKSCYGPGDDEYDEDEYNQLARLQSYVWDLAIKHSEKIENYISTIKMEKESKAILNQALLDLEKLY